MTNGRKRREKYNTKERFRHAAWRGSLIGLSWSCTTTSEQKKTSREEIRMKNVLINAMGRRIFFGRLRAMSAIIMISGLLMCGRDACAQAARPGVPAQFEEASVLVPAGNTCLLHPEGNPDPAQAIPVPADQDGVVRFQAVRPTQPDSVERLALDCTDSTGSTQTYSADLRSEATFAPRPFIPALANLEFRPALTGDPLNRTQQELIQAGYGLRPDPEQNPDGYHRWLAAASAPAYRLRSIPSSPALSGARRRPASQASAESIAPERPELVYTAPTGPGAAYWTGSILSGSYQKQTTAALTHSYVENEATFNVPYVTPGGFWPASAQMSIWNGLDSNNLLQAEVWAYVTASTRAYFIQHQDFGHVTCPATPSCTNSGNDTAAITFTPKAGDTVYAQEWYCDSKGNLDLSGGYACTRMHDVTQGIYWDCTQANSSACQSYTRPASNLVNGTLGTQAEFIIENDTDELPGEGNSHEWPDFSSSPVTMKGSACVVQGNGIGCCGGGLACGKVVTTKTDPTVTLLTDNTSSVPPIRGGGHLRITLPTGGVKWGDLVTNIYYWNGSNFNQYAPGCATSIAVGPNSGVLTHGTPWMTGCTPFADGNYTVYKLQGFYSPVSGTQQLGKWVKVQDDIATQLAVSPEGIPWAINAKGDILYWDGKAFVANGAGGCAKSIGVGPNSGLLTNGTPWIVDCHTAADGNHPVYKLETGSDPAFPLTSWVKMQGDIAAKIAVSPEGIPWAINANGDILYWDGKAFVANPTGGCAGSIGVGASSRGLTNGTPWIIGCQPAAGANYSVYQMQTGGDLVDMQDDVGIQIATSPENFAWVISLAR
jgi:hypothetical protein